MQNLNRESEPLQNLNRLALRQRTVFTGDGRAATEISRKITRTRGPREEARG